MIITKRLKLTALDGFDEHAQMEFQYELTSRNKNAIAGTFSEIPIEKDHEALDRKIRKSLLDLRLPALIGLSGLTVVTGLTIYVPSVKEDFWSLFLFEILMVTSWVAMWKPLNFILHSLPQLYKRRKQAERKNLVQKQRWT